MYIFPQKWRIYSYLYNALSSKTAERVSFYLDWNTLKFTGLYKVMEDHWSDTYK